MDLLNQLMQQIAMPGQKRYEDGSIGTPKQTPSRPAVARGTAPVQRRQSPGVQVNDPRQFKMYEDMSFQGDPRQFIQQNPGYQFYEDGSFAPPSPQLRSQQQIKNAPFRMYEDNTFQGNPDMYQRANPNTRFYEDNSFRQVAPTDPMAQLRQFLGL